MTIAFPPKTEKVVHADTCWFYTCFCWIHALIKRQLTKHRCWRIHFVLNFSCFNHVKNSRTNWNDVFFLTFLILLDNTGFVKSVLKRQCWLDNEFTPSGLTKITLGGTETGGVSVALIRGPWVGIYSSQGLFISLRGIPGVIYICAGDIRSVKNKAQLWQEMAIITKK